jgi:hypothetical protein
MKDRDVISEFLDFLKDEKQKSLVKAYLKNFKIEDVDAELGKLFAGEESET